jgi:hypothetical protein
MTTSVSEQDIARANAIKEEANVFFASTSSFLYSHSHNLAP